MMHGRIRQCSGREGAPGYPGRPFNFLDCSVRRPSAGLFLYLHDRDDFLWSVHSPVGIAECFCLTRIRVNENCHRNGYGRGVR